MGSPGPKGVAGPDGDKVSYFSVDWVTVLLYLLVILMFCTFWLKTVHRCFRAHKVLEVIPETLVLVVWRYVLSRWQGIHAAWRNKNEVFWLACAIIVYYTCTRMRSISCHFTYLSTFLSLLTTNSPSIIVLHWFFLCVTFYFHISLGRERKQRQQRWNWWKWCSCEYILYTLPCRHLINSVIIWV